MFVINLFYLKVNDFGGDIDSAVRRNRINKKKVL